MINCFAMASMVTCRYERYLLLHADVAAPEAFIINDLEDCKLQQMKKVKSVAGSAKSNDGQGEDEFVADDDDIGRLPRVIRVWKHRNEKEEDD